MEFDSRHTLLRDIDMDFLLIKPGQLDDRLTGSHNLPDLGFQCRHHTVPIRQQIGVLYLVCRLAQLSV